MSLPVFLINLDRSAQRLQEASELLGSAGITFERVSAVDGSLITPDELQQINPYPPPNGEWFRPLTPGEIGCFLSHLACWQLIAQRQLKSALILEDDIGLTPDFSPEHFSRLADCGEDWDIIKVARLEPKHKHIRQLASGISLNQCYPVPIDCTAYLVSLRGAEKLIQNRKQLFRPVDFELKHYWERQLTIYSVKPNLFRQKSHEETASVIGTRTGYRKFKPRKKLMVYLRKYRYHLNFFFCSQFHRFFN